MTPNEETILLAFVAIAAITLIVTFVFVLAWYVIMALALMTFFRKVGVEPWIAWVPLYSTWKWLEVGGQQGAFALFSLIPYGSIVTSVFLYIGMYRTGIAFGRDTGFFVLGLSSCLSSGHSCWEERTPSTSRGGSSRPATRRRLQATVQRGSTRLGGRRPVRLTA